MPDGKIGVGVITVQNRDIKPEILNLITHPTAFYVHTDYEHKGPGYGRNECIKNLYDAGCDHFFLFDDDTYPVVKGWQDYFINWVQKTGVNSFGYPHRSKYGEPFHTENDIEYWRWCTGPFQYMSRKMIDTVGYYNLAYERYGYEDVAYLYRARESGICGSGIGDPSPSEVDVYIRSLDIFGDDEFSGTANMTAEEKNTFIESNRPIFDKEVSSGVLYYPYAQV